MKAVVLDVSPPRLVIEDVADPPARAEI